MAPTMNIMNIMNMTAVLRYFWTRLRWTCLYGAAVYMYIHAFPLLVWLEMHNPCTELPDPMLRRHATRAGHGLLTCDDLNGRTAIAASESHPDQDATA
eukprot:6385253-Amphidinium_carterae.1